jgi:hypothetical protein
MKKTFHIRTDPDGGLIQMSLLRPEGFKPRKAWKQRFCMAKMDGREFNQRLMKAKKIKVVFE